jgi:hypothetical protein
MNDDAARTGIRPEIQTPDEIDQTTRLIHLTPAAGRKRP